MNLFKNAFFIALALILTGCASTTHLDPNTALNNGYYTGKIGTQANQGSFKIKAPQIVSHSCATSLLDIIKITDTNSTGLIIGCNFEETDPSVFAVKVTLKKPGLSMAAGQAEFNSSTLNDGLKLILDKQTTLNGYPAHYLVYSDKGSEQSTTSGNITNIHISPAITQGAYFVDYGNYIVNFTLVAGYPMNAGSAAQNASLQHQVMNGTWGPGLIFTNSFKLYP